MSFFDDSLCVTTDVALFLFLHDVVQTYIKENETSTSGKGSVQPGSRYSSHSYSSYRGQVSESPAEKTVSKGKQSEELPYRCGHRLCFVAVVVVVVAVFFLSRLWLSSCLFSSLLIPPLLLMFSLLLLLWLLPCSFSLLLFAAVVVAVIVVAAAASASTVGPVVAVDITVVVLAVPGSLQRSGTPPLRTRADSRADADDKSHKVEGKRTRQFRSKAWKLEPRVRFLSWAGKNMDPVNIDWVLQKLGFMHARLTIPKWVQRGAMDPMDVFLSLLVDRLLAGMRESSTYLGDQ